MKDRQRYTFGYTDHRSSHGEPAVKWEPMRYIRKYDWSTPMAAIGLGLGISMIIAPMAWVELFKWMLS